MRMSLTTDPGVQTEAGHPEPPPHRSDRGTAVAVALLFLLATGTFLTADALLLPAVSGGAAAGTVGDAVLVTAAVLALVDAVAVTAIAVLLLPLLRATAEGWAVGYLMSRVAEVGALMLYAAVPLTMVATAGDEPVPELLGSQYEVAVSLIYVCTAVAGVCLVAALRRARLVPRPLVVLGLVGYPTLLVGTVLSLFGVVDLTSGAGVVAVVPGGLFELALPLWLLVKGFGPGRPGDRPQGARSVRAARPQSA